MGILVPHNAVKMYQILIDKPLPIDISAIEKKLKKVNKLLMDIGIMMHYDEIAYIELERLFESESEFHKVKLQDTQLSRFNDYWLYDNSHYEFEYADDTVKEANNGTLMPYLYIADVDLLLASRNRMAIRLGSHGLSKNQLVQAKSTIAKIFIEYDVSIKQKDIMIKLKPKTTSKSKKISKR